MAKLRQTKSKQKFERFLVLCEGKSEVQYLDNSLDETRYHVQKSKYTNAKKLVTIDTQNQFQQRNWKAIYCVFDRDSGSNTKEQLQEANKFIKNSDGQLYRVCSNPCFEVALWFSLNQTRKFFKNCKELQLTISKQIKDYNKSNFVSSKLNHHFDFNTMCKSSKLNFIGITDDNWLDENIDAYSEIFKLID